MSSVGTLHPEARYVERNQWCVASEESLFHKLETTGLCYDVAVVCLKRGSWAMMARFGADSNLDRIESMFIKIRDINSGSLEGVKTYLIGGSNAYSKKVTWALAKKMPQNALYFISRESEARFHIIIDANKSSKKGIMIDRTQDKVEEPRESQERISFRYCVGWDSKKYDEDD